MAHPTTELIEGLRMAAANLKKGDFMPGVIMAPVIAGIYCRQLPN